MQQKTKNIVMIGGGTGSFTVLSGLKTYPDLDLTAIVTMSDNGGSTGKLRDELGVLPPGDIRQCLVALSDSPQILRDLFTYRFDSGELTGHNFGNLFLSALEKLTGDFDQAVETASQVLSVNGTVLPVTTTNVNLVMQLQNGEEIIGEDTIGSRKDIGELGVQHLNLTPQATLNPKVTQAIHQADMIVIGPGNIYCSLLPALIVPGMKDALQETQATIVYNVNLMAKQEHCPNWEVKDFVKLFQTYLGEDTIDVSLYNTTPPSPDLLQKYSQDGTLVTNSHNQTQIGKTQLRGEDLLASEVFHNPNSKDPLIRTLIRHDSHKIAKALYALL